MSLSASSLGIVEEMLHGVLIRDSYRWLENGNISETRQWLEDQERRTNAYFSSCTALGHLKDRVRTLLSVDAVDQPARLGIDLFYRRRSCNQEQGCIYVRRGETGNEHCLVDPSEEGPFTSVSIHRISDDGALLAFEIKKGGRDQVAIRVVDTKSGRILPCDIEQGYGRGFVFDANMRGCYFCQEAPSATGHHIIRHRVFTEPDRDRVVFSRPRTIGSRLVLAGDKSHIGAIWMHMGDAGLVCDFLVASQSSDGEWKCVFRDKPLPVVPAIHRGRIFVLSYEGKPNGAIVELGIDGREIRSIVPERDAPPSQIAMAGNRFFVVYLANGRHSLHSWTSEGQYAGEIDIPTNGTIQLLNQHGPIGDNFFYTVETFAHSPAIFEYRTRAECTVPFEQSPQSLEHSTCEVVKSRYASTDGTSIPVTLVARDRLALRENRPVIMTAYGGFGVAMTPRYSVLVTIMMELGAVFVIPHIRGGGEFGKPWHEAGRRRNRQTAIDDFIAAAEWLCTNGITAPSRLAIFGGSNSGLLVGAAMTQRPGLFRAVLCIAPLTDMVRYERFDQASKWQDEFGSAANEDDFPALLSYSPYHRVRRNVDYPSTLFVSGDLDERCNPAHARKMTALLQGRAAQRNPILIDYSAERGHSPVMPLSVRISALSRRLAFLCRELEIPVFPEVPYELTDC